MRIGQRRVRAPEAMAARRSRGGFTLLEVMIALTLMAIGALSLAALQLIVMDYGARGRNMSQASAIAQTRMETLQRLRWSDAGMQPTGGAWSGPATVNVQMDAGTAVGTQQSYDVYVRIADLVAGVTRSVDVRVDWTEPDRPTRSYALSSIRYNRQGL